MTYKELKDRFFEEVGKVDLSKLGLTFGGLKDYAELLKVMAEIPDETKEDSFKNGVGLASAVCNGFSGFGSSATPRVEEKED